MNSGLTFDQESTQRIGRVVQVVERARPDLIKGRRTFNTPSGPIMLAKTDADIAKGASGSVTLYYQPDSSTDKGDESASTDTETAFARLGNVDSGKWVYIMWLGAGWEIINAECPAALLP